MNDTELKEFNDFVGANPIRNNFLPVMDHICKLTKGLDVDEIGDKDGNTTAVQFHLKLKDYDIDGRVCYDWCGDIKPELKNNIIFELWWDDECYCLKHTLIETQNMLTILIRGAGKPMYGYKTYEELKLAQRSKTLLPIT